MALATAHVDIVANTDRFEKDLQSKLKQTGASSGQAFQRAFQSAVSKVRAPAISKRFGDQGKSAGQTFAREFSKAAGSARVGGGLTKGIGKTVDRDGKSMGRRFGTVFVKAAAAPIAGIGKGMMTALSSIMDVGGGANIKTFGALAAAAGSATIAIAPLTKAIAALPAAVGGAATSIGTLVVAFQGMGEAISAGMSGDMEEFREALDGLAPSAQNVAKEVVGLKPAFDSLKGSVQGAFFEPLVDSIGRLSDVITGNIQTGMTNLAKALGEASAAVTDFFASPQGGEAMQAVFDGIATSVRNITPAIQPLLQGLTDMAAAGADRLGGIAPMLEGIGNAMSNFAQSGGVDRWLTAASTAARQLWEAIQPLGPGLSAMFNSLGTYGASVRGMMVPAFEALGEAMEAVAPVFRQLFDIMGTTLGTIIPPIAEAFSGLAKTLASILVPAFTALEPVIQKISEQMGPVLMEAVRQLVPMLLELGRAIGSVLGPAIAALKPVLDMILPILVSNFQNIVGVVKGAVKFLTGIFKTLGAVIQGDWAAAWEGVKQILVGAWQFIWNFLKVWLLGKALKVIKLFGGMLKGLWNRIWAAVSGTVSRWVGQIVAWVTRMKDRILGFFSNAGMWLVQAGKSIMQGFLNGLKSLWGKVTGFVGSIGSWIKNNKGPLSYDRQLLVPAGRAIMAGFAEGLRDGWRDVASTIHGITDKLPSEFAAGANSAPFAQNPMPMPQARDAVSAGLLPPAGASGGQRVTNNNRTTTVGAPTIHVTSASEDPARVARKTANRLAQLSTA